MMELNIESIGLLGPGLSDWHTGREQLTQAAQWQWQELVIPAPVGLPSAERRRVGQAVKLAMAAAQQACDRSQYDSAILPSVFTSSGGDGQNCHILCDALSEPDPQISPTRFTNSVHNAPSGYWSIASGCQAGSTSICGFDGSFAAGLIEAALLALTEQTPVLMVAYDVPYLEPLAAVRRIVSPVAIALVLAPADESTSLPRITINPQSTNTETRLHHDGLEALRLGAPAARGLALLSAIARAASGTIVLPAPGNTLIELDLQCP